MHCFKLGMVAYAYNPVFRRMRKDCECKARLSYTARPYKIKQASNSYGKQMQSVLLINGTKMRKLGHRDITANLSVHFP